MSPAGSAHVFLSVGAGSGCAIAAGNNKTIHGCVDNGTRVLHVQKQCHRGQSRLIWNQSLALADASRATA
jgi:hypothetical protein